MSVELPSDTIGLIEGLTTTRAIRRFRPEPVPEDDLNTILFCASRAPTGSNRQTFRFLVLRDGPIAQQAKALIKRGAEEIWEQKRTDERYDAVVVEQPRSPKARIDAAVQHLIDNFERVPVVVLPCLIRYRPPTSSEGGSIYPACQNLLLAARALGYGGVITGYHSRVEPELRALLGIPDGVFIAATIPLGQPEGGHGPVRRRPLSELVYEERWEEPAAWAVDPPDTRFLKGNPYFNSARPRPD